MGTRLAHPSDYADYVVAFDGDPVAEAMRGQSLRVLTRSASTGQPPTIYLARDHARSAGLTAAAMPSLPTGNNSR